MEAAALPQARSRDAMEEGEPGRRLRVNRPEIRDKTPRQSDGNQSTIIIPMNMTLQEVLTLVQKWKANRVIEETTLTFRTEALVLNKNFKNEMLSSVVFEFSMHRGGNVFTEAKIVTLVLSPVASEILQAGMGVMWVLCLGAFSVMLSGRTIQKWKQQRFRSHCFRFWTLLEWGIILWGWMVFGVFFFERARIWSLKTDISDYRNKRRATVPWKHAELDTSNLKEFLDTADGITELSMWCQMLVALYHIILVCRFFLASRGQPRLAVVLSTIRKASVDLGHLLIVFMIIFIAYAVSGHILFGRRLEEFATFQGAFARCFQIVMERQYTWTEFTEEDLWTATIWVWSFLLIVVLVLVNIFLAMIFDTYGDVRSNVGNSATLWQTTKIVLLHLRHSLSFGSGGGEETTRWVPNRELVNAVKAMQCQYVTPWMVKDAFPGISNRQVNYIFHLGKNRLENMLFRGYKSSLPAVIASILLGVERMHQGLVMMEGNSKSIEEKSSDMARAGHALGLPPTKEEDVLVNMTPPDAPPPWVRVQLMPHFQKQRNLLTQVHMQIQRIEKAMQSRGLSVDIGPPPGSTPRNLKVRNALGSPGSTMLPQGPSGATSAVGLVPTALLSPTAGGFTEPRLDDI
jgi:hypothetical protein